MLPDKFSRLMFQLRQAFIAVRKNVFERVVIGICVLVLCCLGVLNLSSLARQENSRIAVIILLLPRLPFLIILEFQPFCFSEFARRGRQEVGCVQIVGGARKRITKPMLVRIWSWKS